MAPSALPATDRFIPNAAQGSGLRVQGGELLPTAPSPEPRAAVHALTVGQVVAQIRALIERQFPTALWVEGELSNCTYAASGHIYFSLVDERATDRFGQRLVLPCAFYRGVNQALRFKLTDGLKVLCLGEVTTYERQGQYQLRVLRLEPRGIGALQLAFEQLKRRLSAEGLFDEARKRALPLLPERVGIVTSPSGSAIHDILSKLRGVFDLVVLPVKVQGEGAPSDIVAAIEAANRLRVAEVLIVGRGGGSVEDLWAFNDEGVARALARSRIPIISAVGHQDDWTISDYAADVRASTPTDAARLLLQGRETIAREARELMDALQDAMRSALDARAQHLERLTESLRLLHPLTFVERGLARAQELETRLRATMRYALDGAERRLTGLAGRLQALSPLAVLARGYSITFTLPERRVLTSAGDVAIGDELETRLASGTVGSVVSRRSLAPGGSDGSAS